MRRLVALVLAALSLGAAPWPAPVALEALLAETPAPTLDAYRLFTDPGGRAPNAGVTPYALNTPLFSDHAAKSRFIFLPPGTKAGYRATGPLDLPVGAALVKTFAYPSDLRQPGIGVRKIETRLLIHQTRGWVALTYLWNAEQNQAVLKRAGTRLPVQVIDMAGLPLTIDYAVPNVNQCKECHGVSGELSPIGPKARNLNGDFTYRTGPENQLAHWTRVGLLAGAPPPAQAPRTAVWNDAHEPLDDRARAYLDANCGHCHNPQGMASNSGLFLHLEETDPSARGLGKHPVAAGRGSGDLAVDVVPGRPEASILLYRMRSREPGVMMPELGRSVVDEDGVALIAAYLKQMPPPR
jgi:uncharacterized repeat protein (TIGR03806 family)